MSEENKITNSGYTKIFHPVLLKYFDVKENDYAIIPKYVGSDKIEELVNISNEKNDKKILTSEEINDEIFGLNFFLTVTLQIKSLEDVFSKIDDLISANRKLQTIDLLMNMILENFYSEIDDIYIDKFIDFYQKYFSLFFKTQIDYKKIFKAFQNSLKEKSHKIHSEIVNNILKK